VRFVVLREPDLPDTALLALARGIRAVLPDGAVLAVHGRPDLARRLGAGLHLPEAAPPPPPDGPWHGRSVHDVGSVARAILDGPRYLVAGTLHATPGKPGVPGIGVAGLRLQCEAAGAVPVFAIGGIDAGRAGAARVAGAHGVAVVGAILEAEDPAGAAAALLRALD
jgi:thiamine-phosphate pyrophosphorylase